MPSKNHRQSSSNRRRLLVAGLLGPAACLTLAGAWEARLGLDVREHLQAARDALERLPASAPHLMGEALADARRHAAEAHRLTAGPDWSLLTHAPFLGDGATAVRGLAGTAAELTDVLATVHQAGEGLVRPGGLSMRDVPRLLGDLAVAAPKLEAAAARIDRARQSLAATPAATGLAELDTARASALRETDRLLGYLRAGAGAAALFPPMLGHDGPRHYFLAFQTNAEARGTGGLVGAFGILNAGRDGIGITRLSANNALPRSPVPVADHGPAYRARYGPGAAELLSISNLSPHFPYAAATWTGLWRRHTGQRLDGAIATDPVGLSRMLELIGPVRLPSGEMVTARNVVDLTEREAYARFDDPRRRKRYLIKVAGAVVEAMFQARPDPLKAVSALSRMVEERRIQIWSRHEAEERRLAATPLGGVLPSAPGPFAGLVVNNSAGNKLDYYLGRSLEYRLGRCGGGWRASRVHVRLDNDVPRRRLPAYVTARLDSPQREHAEGSTLLWVSMYASVGSRLAEARVDGKRIEPIREVERSHPVYSTVLEFAPGQARTLDFMLLEPASAAAPAVPVQPLVRPQATTVLQDPTGCAAAPPES
ncbi:DUF4012 domain-containing protein [Nonomuraea rhodomycinica]|uniref:DUF4012 domain-containing protein n=1 Tax=Nonomuraea rhodomycinica TaxID=1712872 RepID=A0A7Y6IQV7_9ACTN|nr:DUF4012 domain-containing protein [Nonomuraea rhodomycinica]NUW42426.1 DUF4012 domain-containing protein [Nonomuraea rhodomycinica]